MNSKEFEEGKATIDGVDFTGEVSEAIIFFPILFARGISWMARRKKKLIDYLNTNGKRNQQHQSVKLLATHIEKEKNRKQPKAPNHIQKQKNIHSNSSNALRPKENVSLQKQIQDMF